MTADGAPLALAPVRTGWHGQLRLRFESRAGRTVMAGIDHQGPLRVQKPLYPDAADTAQVILLHPPAGLVHGDTLDYALDVGPCARVQFTTPGAGKFYGGGTRTASTAVHIRIAAGGSAEWLPQETILFDGALGEARLEVDLESGGRFCGWEVLCFGRPAAAERFRRGAWSQQLQIRVDGRPVWFECGVLRAGDMRFDSACGLDGHAVMGTLLVAGVDGMTLPVEALRSIDAPASARVGVSALPEVLVARYLGDCAEDARRYFSMVWSQLRPLLCGRAFSPPRIWST